MGCADFKVITKKGRLPSDRTVQEYADEILSAGGPNVIRHVAGKTTINYIARQHDVGFVLRKDQCFNLSHYDELLGQVAGKIRFLLGDPDVDRELKWQLLSKALGGADISQPFDEEQISALVDKAVADTIADIKDPCENEAPSWWHRFRRSDKKNPATSFKLIWDYGMAVPFRVATDYFGIDMPRKLSWKMSALLWLARLAGIKPGSEKIGRGMLATLFWSLPVNLHIFKNFEGRSWLMRKLATWGAEAYAGHINDNIKKPGSPDDTLLGRLKKAAGQFPNSHKPEVRAKLDNAILSILFELHGTMLILVSIGFNRSLRALFKEGISINRFVSQLNAAEYDHKYKGTPEELQPIGHETLNDLDAEQLLNEALRFEPVAGRLFRRVDEDMQLCGTSFKKGEYICLLTDATPYDERAFACPQSFRTDRDIAQYLNFGPRNGPHACKGQAWARSILTAMFKGLTQMPNVRPVDPEAAKKEGALGVPNGLEMRFGPRDPEEAVDRQQLITIVVPVKDSLSANLDAIDLELDKLGNPASCHKQNGKLSLKDRLDKTEIIHFASLSLIRSQKKEPSYLVFEISADGKEKQVIAKLCEMAKADFLPVFQLSSGLKSENDLEPLLQDHCKKMSTDFLRFGKLLGLGFKGTAGLDVTRINFEHRTAQYARSLLEKFRDSHGQFGKMPLEYLHYVRLYFAKVQGELREALDPGSPLHFVDASDAPWMVNKGQSPLMKYIRLVGIMPRTLWVVPVLLLLINVLIYRNSLCDGPCDFWYSWLIATGHASMVTLPAALLGTVVVAALLWGWLRASEKKNTPVDPDRDPDVIDEIMQRENSLVTQNHMVGITYIIPGLLRYWLTLPFALRMIQKGVLKGFSRSGFFDDIGTIHFARWIVLPKTKTLVFMSNYDGSFESYLEDFITKATKGLTGIWSNCIGFPKTKNLFWKGGDDGDRFKRYARRSMQPTRFWYSAYDLSAQQIRKNALIRDGIARIKTASDAEAWLELFNSVPRPHYALETEEIQNIVFGGSRHLQNGRCLLVNFGDAPRSKIQAWLQSIEEDVEWGDTKPDEKAVFMALSRTGLAKIGVNYDQERQQKCGVEAPDCFQANESNFPPAFELGMAHPTREQVMKDVGESAPKNWAWGGSDKTAADAAIILYANDNIYSELALLRKKLKSHGLDEIHLVTMRPQYEGPIREPFGFVDGTSQPKLRGTKQAADYKNPLHVVEPGEFVLGYHDNRGYFPPTLRVPAEWDAWGSLPSEPLAMPSRYPDFDNEFETTRDFGRNGSFLVIRQLHQKVDEFEDWLDANARPQDKLPKEKLAAKLVGRWRKTGASIVRYPHQPPDDTEPDNDFLFGQEDPQGERCPFGAHIRRTNPRDSQNPESEEELLVSNRHRILRRGRSYEDGEDQGLFFMCLNADIERQFEFIQQNWMLSSTFHGLHAEVDPIANNGSTEQCPHFSIPHPTAPRRLKGLSSFVTTKGGGYFFLPSKSAVQFLSKLGTKP